MPVPSIESVNSTSASNIGDLLQQVSGLSKGNQNHCFRFSHVVVYAGQRFVNRGRVQKR